MYEISSSTNFLRACFEYLILGTIQGLSEFLPISSTAHLKVIPMLIGWDDPGVSVSAVLQLGSIIAVIAYFRTDLQRISRGFSLALIKGRWRETDSQLGIAIAIGTVPIILVGMWIKFFWPGYTDSILRSIPSIGVISILMAVLLAFAEVVGKRVKDLKKVRGFDGLVIGMAQILALIPGVSRSGITLTASLLYGWKHYDGARFSFILGIPAITIAGIVELKNSFESTSLINLIPLTCGIISSALVSWLAIDWLLNFLQKNNSWIFIAYRLFFGLSLLFWWGLNPTNIF